MWFKKIPWFTFSMWSGILIICKQNITKISIEKKCIGEDKSNLV